MAKVFCGSMWIRQRTPITALHLVEKLENRLRDKRVVFMATKKGQEGHLLSFLFYGQKTGARLLLLTVEPLADDVYEHTRHNGEDKSWKIHVYATPFLACQYRVATKFYYTDKVLVAQYEPPERVVFVLT